MPPGGHDPGTARRPAVGAAVGEAVLDHCHGHPRTVGRGGRRSPRGGAGAARGDAAGAVGKRR
eukprot:11180900-Lingulodinium_polyedra.AAC.1